MVASSPVLTARRGGDQITVPCAAPGTVATGFVSARTIGPVEFPGGARSRTGTLARQNNSAGFYRLNVRVSEGIYRLKSEVHHDR